MARTDYGAILSTVIKDTSDAIREVNDTSALIAPNAWGANIRTMHSDADYETALSYIPTKTVSGAIASFNDGAGGLNLKSLKVAITATQSGSGTPAPDNIRPIIGVSECNVCNTPMPVSQLWNIDSLFNGVVNFNQLVQNGNFADGTTGWSAISPNHSSLSVVDNTLILTHTATSNRSYGVSTSCAFVANHKYLIKGTAKKTMVDSDPDSKGFKLYCDTDLLKTYSASQNDVVTLDTIVSTLNSGTLFKISFLGGIGTPASDDSMMELNNINVIDLTQMFGSTIADNIYTLEQNEAGAGVAFFRSIYPNDYYAYDTGTDEMVGSREGNTYIIQLGDTYYGGELDVTTGVLTVTHGYVDMGSLEWARKHTSTTYYYFVATPEPFKANNFNFISSVYVNSNQIRTRLNDKEMGLFNTSSTETYIQIVVRDDSYETVEAFIASVTGQQLVYELATPITVQLTPAQVEQLLGQNNVWTDTGDITECVYYSTASGVQSVEGEYQRTDATGVSSVPYLIYTFTATEDCTMCFCGTIATDTSQSQGFLKMVVNDSDEYRTAGLVQYNETPFSLDNISLQSGDTVKFYGDWEGSHSSCFFHLRLSMVKAV